MQVQIVESTRAVFTVEETAEILGIGRTSAYEAIRRNEIPSLRIGKRVVVPRGALARLLDGTGELNHAYN